MMKVDEWFPVGVFLVMGLLVCTLVYLLITDARREGKCEGLDGVWVEHEYCIKPLEIIDIGDNK
jgi:hypothetical protein